MKITAIKTSMLKVPNEAPVSTYYPSVTYVAARIQTDAGIEGLGYTMLMGGMGAEAVHAYLQHNLVPRLIGEDPLHVGKLWNRMYDNDRGLRKKGIPVYAISAIDIGLWDILGKSMGRPLWQIFGAHTDKVPVYGSGGFLSYTVDQIVREAQGFLEEGVRHYKLKIGRSDVMEDVTRVGEVRQALGDEVEILADVNQRWDVATNIRVGRMLEDCRLYWYEEPVYADNIEQCAEVARNIRIPVATGENEYTRYGFRDLIQAEAAQFLNPDIHRAGGFTAMLEIAHLAAAYDVKIAPHLVPELSVSVLVSIPNAALVEVLAGAPSNLWRDPVEIAGGYMTPPNRPGHGTEFSKEVLKKYAV